MREAVAAHADGDAVVGELFVTAAAASRHVEIVRAALTASIPVTEVTAKAAAAITDSVSPQGIVARCTIPDRDPTDLLDGGPHLVAVLVETADPGNAGTVIRLADAVGADGVILAGAAVDAYNPKAVRASAGSIFHLPVYHVDDPSDLPVLLRAADLLVLATTRDAATDLPALVADGALAGPTAWLFGSEAHGLPRSLLDAADATVAVPIYGRAESLNLAAAAAVCLYASASAQRG